jgi:regulator of protease activity HflC (stomatin/prohibitin superfamily)
VNAWTTQARDRIVALRDYVRPTASKFMALLTDRRWRKHGAAAALALATTFLVSRAVARVGEGEVGVFVNNISGVVSVEQRVGYHVFVPWVTTPYLLDRRIQALNMADGAADGFAGGDAVKVKTSDGSNVALDIQVTFRLLPEKAGEIVVQAGPGMAFGDLWVRSAVRAMAAREFGKLTTEDVYDAAARNERAHAVVDGLNDELADRGVEIVAVVPQEFRFYKEYEEVIKKKKLADQEVEELRAKARLAAEEQKRKVAEADFEGQARIATAQGEAEKVEAEADGYVQRVRLEAEGQLATAEKQAEARLATGMADAEGMRLAASAVAGSGGVNLVALEYAKQLQKISFTGVPVLQDGRMGQYRITQAPANDNAAVLSQNTKVGGGQ